MTVTFADSVRRGLYGLVAGGLLTATAAAVIALPVAGSQRGSPCNQTVGQSINSYLQRHPDVHQQLPPSPRRRVAAPTSSTT